MKVEVVVQTCTYPLDAKHMTCGIGSGQTVKARACSRGLGSRESQEQKNKDRSRYVWRNHATEA